MMKIRLFALLLASMPLIACGKNQVAHQTTSAHKTQVADGIHKTITEKLEKTYKNQQLTVQSIHNTPIEGLFEVVVSGNQIIYTDSKAEYMIVGDLINIDNKQNLTNERQADLNKIDYASLPFEYAITEVRGNGKQQIVVFSDPDCPYCKRLEREFAKMTDITIHTFLMPLTSLHPDAVRKAEQIWCQADKTQAWVNFMREGKMPQKVAVCDNPVETLLSLSQQLGFNGTPTLVFPNGKTQSGYAPAEHLTKIIEANQK